MKYLISDKELLDYVTGRMEISEMKDLEHRAVRSGQTDLLLYAQLADYAATGTSTDDIIGEDTFMENENMQKINVSRISFPIAAERIKPTDKDLNKK